MPLILTLNAGSSSLRFTLFSGALEPLLEGHIDAIGKAHCYFKHSLGNGKEAQEKVHIKDQEAAIKYALEKLASKFELKKIEKVAHRVVHGGEQFTKPTLLNMLNIRKLEKLSHLAPLHNPANLAAIKSSRKLLKRAKHYAIFDTSFHSSLPEKAYLYGLPYKLYKKEGIRRYGFHGTSHKYVATEALKLLKKRRATIITCHIGNGVSLAAIKNGVCLDTSMGFTPLEGPMMGTRSGSIDPAIIFELAKKRPLEKVNQLLQHESGFKGVSEISPDVRELYARAKSSGTKRAFELFSYQMAKEIAGLMVAIDGPPDALVFTAGIGEHAFYLRSQIANQLKAFGLQLDTRKNQANALTISTSKSAITCYVIPTNEERQMAREIMQA